MLSSAEEDVGKKKMRGKKRRKNKWNAEEPSITPTGEFFPEYLNRTLARCSSP